LPRALPKAPILPSDSVQIVRRGTLDRAGPSVYVFADALDEVLFHAEYRDEASVTLLIGGRYAGPAGRYIEVEGFTASRYVAHIDDAAVELGRRLPELVRDLTDPTEQVLGWSYGQAGSGGQMTQAALRTHYTWFNLPHQLFLSIDPSTQQYGFHQRGPDGRMHNVGFNLVRAHHEGS
jgi:hypothetical protein